MANPGEQPSDTRDPLRGSLTPAHPPNLPPNSGLNQEREYFKNHRNPLRAHLNWLSSQCGRPIPGEGPPRGSLAERQWQETQQLRAFPAVNSRAAPMPAPAPPMAAPMPDSRSQISPQAAPISAIKARMAAPAPKNGMKWTSGEIDYLLHHRTLEDEKETAHAEIAKFLGRTTLACRLEVYKYSQFVLGKPGGKLTLDWQRNLAGKYADKLRAAENKRAQGASLSPTEKSTQGKRKRTVSSEGETSMKKSAQAKRKRSVSCEGEAPNEQGGPKKSALGKRKSSVGSENEASTEQEEGQSDAMASRQQAEALTDEQKTAEPSKSTVTKVKVTQLTPWSVPMVGDDPEKDAMAMFRSWPRPKSSQDMAE